MKIFKHYVRLTKTILYSFFHQKKFIFNNRKLKYIFKKGVSNKLLVVFPAASKKTIFNYITTLKKTNHNVLFLKDTFGKPGSYFLGQNFKFNLFEVVDELIKRISNEKQYLIISLGSSKGGTSALFYGLLSSLNIYRVISGSPQYLLGDYFYNHGGKGYLLNICNGDSFEESIKLDKFCRNLVLNSKKYLKIILYGSTLEDEYHINDIDLLINDLSKTNNNLNFIDAKFIGHKGLADSFRDFLNNKLNNYLK